MNYLTLSDEFYCILRSLFKIEGALVDLMVILNAYLKMYNTCIFEETQRNLNETNSTH